MSRFAYGGLVLAAAVAGFGVDWSVNGSSAALAIGQARAAVLSDDDLRPVLQARYDAMKAAIASRDAAALASILAPGFTSVDVSGSSEDAAQMIADLKRLTPDPHKTSTTTLVSVTPIVDAVTVEQRYDMQTSKTVGGVRHSIELITQSTDTWVEAPGGWQIERTVTEEVSYFRDGQIVMHKVRS